MSNNKKKLRKKQEEIDVDEDFYSENESVGTRPPSPPGIWNYDKYRWGLGFNSTTKDVILCNVEEKDFKSILLR